MAKQNIKPLDALIQVQKEANAILSDLKSINRHENLELENFKESPEFQEILEKVGKQVSEISQHLSEINERLNG